MRLGDMWTGTEIGTDDVAVDDACVSAVLVARTVVVDTSTTAKVVEPVDEALSEDKIFVSVVVVDIESSELVVAKESTKEDDADTTDDDVEVSTGEAAISSAYEKLGENRTRPNARERERESKKFVHVS
jgi:hypothetical protein